MDPNLVFLEKPFTKEKMIEEITAKIGQGSWKCLRIVSVCSLNRLCLVRKMFEITDELKTKA